MNPVSTFDELCHKILQNYEDNTVVTVGVLLADGRQDDAKQYIINYMDMFDKHSGKYIDFYLPGYYEYSDAIEEDISKKYHPNLYTRWRNYNSAPAFFLRRTGAEYFFDGALFDDFIEEMTYRMGVHYTYNPMLLLIEVNKTSCRGEIEFQKKLVIELDDNANTGVRRTGQLFDAIFEEAKRSVGLNRFGTSVRMYYIKGKRVENLIRALSGEWIEAVANIVGDVYRYRIR